MFRYFSFALHFILGLVPFFSVFYCSLPAQAAESVVLKYRIFQEKVSVPELSTLAETGEASSSLRAYLRLAQREPEELRRTLTQEINVDPIFLSTLLNSFVGEVMLDRVSLVVHTPSNRANRESLRSALVTSALPDDQITLIEVLENYPTSEVHVNGDQLAEMVQYLKRVTGSLPVLRL